jgi:hypothetical protein
MTSSMFGGARRIVRVVGVVTASTVCLVSPALAGPAHGLPTGPSPACDRLVALQAEGRAQKTAVGCSSSAPDGAMNLPGGSEITSSSAVFDLIDIF